MLIKLFNKPAIFSGTYIILSIIAFAYHIIRHGYDKFSAIFIGMLTMPWSLLVALTHDLIIAGIFKYEIGYFGKNIILIICVIVNASLIFAVANRKKVKNA